MPLSDPFAQRVATIETYLMAPPFRVLEISRPPDLELMVRKLLSRMAEAPDDPHAWIYSSAPFADYHTFFESVIEVIGAESARAASDLDDLGIVLPSPPELDPDVDDGPVVWARTAAHYASAVAEALTDDAGSLALILEPGAVSDRRAWGWAVGALAWYGTSDWFKLIVIDHDQAPVVPLDGGVADRVVRVAFAVSPEEIEAQIGADLAEGHLSPAESRQYRLLAGAFATSAGRFDEAEAHLRASIETARETGAPIDRANGLYNLGNLYLRTRRFDEATTVLVEAASLSLDEGPSALGAMALTNLAIALHRQGRLGEAHESFAAARDLFRTLRHVPGEAHVLDCTARMRRLEGDDAGARRDWVEADALYGSITASHLSEVREGGRAEIRARLHELDATAAG
ncbi:MAG: tetratricopeptide repeat protein [Gemmatimonadetes bacterium]|nr:tetratricopeptide repeat protein [Gemmatimonadota bacterium]